MLAHILAFAVGLGSIALYLAAFFFPEVHRKHDFFWSGVGCFYALVLWVDAAQISTTELSGHLASIALLTYFGWQTLSLRRKRTPRDLQTPLTDQSWQEFGREIASLSAGWLRQTPLKRFLPRYDADHISLPVQEGPFRASSLRQVGYEYLDDLPPTHSSSPTQKSTVTESSSVAVQPDAPARDRITGAQPKIARKPEGTLAAELSDTSRSIQKPDTLWKKAVVLKDWLVEVITTAAKPKPKKPVIVIPPREKSVQETDHSPGGSTQNQVTSKPDEELTGVADGLTQVKQRPMSGDEMSDTTGGLGISSDVYPVEEKTPVKPEVTQDQSEVLPPSRPTVDETPADEISNWGDVDEWDDGVDRDETAPTTEPMGEESSGISEQ